MITFLDSNVNLSETEKCLDSQFWHACAGSMVQIPPVNSKVFYFPQGHFEHSCQNVDFVNSGRVPPYVVCRVLTNRFMADPETDEVYANMRLVPVNGNEVNCEDDGILGNNGSDAQDKPTSFAKTLTQSDANNGGGFSVPRYCAETIFPRLDYSADPPVQTILAKDVHGETWKFRHIYRGTPRRHLLTTGWSTFVNQKKLVAGDSIVFLRAENGDLCVGIRRAKRGIGGNPEITSGWNPAGGNCVVPYGGFSAFLRDDENKLTRYGDGGIPCGSGMSKGKVRAESVIEAATLAANGQPFEVVYYPRASTPEFCVKASQVKSAMQIRWCSGMRFKMPFETEDSSRISWFMGTISSVQVADPMRWPDSPWRLLQVTWDEPDLLQNVKSVSPWLVELVSSMASIHMSPLSPPRKKLRLPQHSDFPLDWQIPIAAFSGNLLGHNSPFNRFPDNTPAGMQGARHTQYGLPLPEFHFNKLQSGLFPPGFSPFGHGCIPTRSSINPTFNKASSSENISCLLSIGNSTPAAKKSDDQKPQQFLLFGQPILTKQDISLSSSGLKVSLVGAGNSSSEGDVDKVSNLSDGDGSASGSGFAIQRHAMRERPSCEGLLRCKELYRKLATMFGTKSSDMLNHVLYRDIRGAVKHIGDESFSDFAKTAKRLTILTDASSNSVGI
ncbi:auxin response factor 18-like isoform X2 [Apium graveolens]|uniref:auxin response factor 18-like isoform X2 n=1 Tax=Apium graveolens TaxID=4045 RepID=UPI003D78D296